jgi:hypothetical protein
LSDELLAKKHDADRARMYAVSRRIVRWLNRLSPKLVNFGAKVIADELALPRRESDAAPRARERGGVRGAAANDQAVTVPMTIGDVSFMLHLRPILHGGINIAPLPRRASRTNR